MVFLREIQLQEPEESPGLDAKTEEVPEVQEVPEPKEVAPLGPLGEGQDLDLDF